MNFVSFILTVSTAILRKEAFFAQTGLVTFSPISWKLLSTWTSMSIFSQELKSIIFGRTFLQMFGKLSHQTIYLDMGGMSSKKFNVEYSLIM